MRPYPCDLCTAWHIGHKPRAVMRGEVSASDFYAARRGALDVPRPIGRREGKRRRHDEPQDADDGKGNVDVPAPVENAIDEVDDERQDDG